MFDLVWIVKTLGYIGLFLITFAESGFLIGFFLPGDSLLFTAGLLASQGIVDLKILIVVAFAGAVLGDSFGYFLGNKFGPKIFKRPDSLLFHKDHLERARVFYEKHGGKTIVIARFLPFIRTFAPILAGVGKMRYRSFVFYNISGGLLWTAGLSILGFLLGNIIPSADKYILAIVLLIIFISVLPIIFSILRNKKYRHQIRDQLLAMISKKNRPE